MREEVLTIKRDSNNTHILNKSSSPPSGCSSQSHPPWCTHCQELSMYPFKLCSVHLRIYKHISNINY